VVPFAGKSSCDLNDGAPSNGTGRSWDPELCIHRKMMVGVVCTNGNQSCQRVRMMAEMAHTSGTPALSDADSGLVVANTVNCGR
jgi:hypothetical protein